MKKTARGWAEHILWITHTLTDANASNRTSFIKSTYGAWRRSMSATERLHCGADGETVSHRSLPPCKICFIKEGDWTLTSTSTWCFGEKQHASRTNRYLLMSQSKTRCHLIPFMWLHWCNFRTMNILCAVGSSLQSSLAVLQFFNRDTFIRHFVAHTGHIRDTSWAGSARRSCVVQ